MFASRQATATDAKDREALFALRLRRDTMARNDRGDYFGQREPLVLPPSVPNPNLVVIASQTSTTTFREDSTDNRFFIFGSVISGILRFEVVRRLATGEYSSIIGREFFDAMMAHFGARVKIIEGNWSNANPERLSNLIRFNQATANPKTPLATAALLATRTGQWADDYGCSRVTFVVVDPPLTFAHARGNFTHVVVHFSK
jgi:hypothetical protein